MKRRPYSAATVLVVLVIGRSTALRGQGVASETTRASNAARDLRAATAVNGAASTPYSLPPLGPVTPENIKLTGTLIPPNALTDWSAAHRLRFFGWANGGYTWSSAGTGLLQVEPRENRFGDAWLSTSARSLTSTLARNGSMMQMARVSASTETMARSPGVQMSCPRE